MIMKFNKLVYIAMATVVAITFSACSYSVLMPSNQHPQLVSVTTANKQAKPAVKHLKPAVSISASTLEATPVLANSFLEKLNQEDIALVQNIGAEQLQVLPVAQLAANSSAIAKFNYSKSDTKRLRHEIKSVLKHQKYLSKQALSDSADPALSSIGWVFIILGILITLLVSILVGLLMMIVGLMFVNSGKSR